MLSDLPELRDKINRYLTRQFIGFADDVPLDECATEASDILKIIDDYLREHIVNMNIPAESVIKRED